MTLRRRWRELVNVLDQALHALGDNQLRTYLSVLGIAIGIASVIAVGSIGKGGHYLVFKELETFGLKSVWVKRLDDDKGPYRASRRGSGIDELDLQSIRDAGFATIARTSPIVYGSGALYIHSGSQYSNGKVTGIDVAYLDINNDGLSAGIGIRSDDVRQRRKVAIIGQTVANDLFGGSIDVIGKEFRINDAKYVVVGLLEAKSRDFLASIGSAGQDANNRILLPYTTLQAQMGNHDIHAIQAEAQSFEQAPLAAQQMTDLLTRRHGERFRYHSDTMARYIDTANQILRGVSLIGVLAAAISLLVGGMGIMNIVATSVLERTREIGLRKAIGASQHLILLQFLLESVIISTIGGLIGLVFGGVVSVVLSWLTGFPLAPEPATIVLALLVSMAVGLLSGYFPARRAARLRPVDALRYE